MRDADLLGHVGHVLALLILDVAIGSLPVIRDEEYDIGATQCGSQRFNRVQIGLGLVNHCVGRVQVSTYRNNLDALFGEVLCGFLRGVASDTTDLILFVERRVFEDGLDDGATLLPRGAKNGDDLGHDESWRDGGIASLQGLCSGGSFFQ